MEVVKPIAALLADPDQGPFRTLIIDSIIGQAHFMPLLTTKTSSLSSGI
jgi:hypothetical protein